MLDEQILARKMGILSFLRRKKKDEALALPAPSLEKLELGLPGIEKREAEAPALPTLPSLPALPSLPSAAEPSFKEFAASPRDISKDIELISAKLDAIKSMIENLSHRLERLEAAQKQKERETIRW